MALSRFFKHEVIRGKDVYVVDDHHKVLAAWTLIRRRSLAAPNLITIDHHTDVLEAFLGHASLAYQEGRTSDEVAFRKSRMALVDWRSDERIAAAIEDLAHDEHIDAATCSGVLADAFCVQLSDSSGAPLVDDAQPGVYALAGNRIYVLPFNCFIGCEAKPHNDVCLVRQSDEIVESRYLDDQLQRCSEIARSIGSAGLEAEPYILDIDLDVFHSRRAINPEDSSTFYRLIRNATAITIATEAKCVELEWLDDQDVMTTEQLLQALLAHINQALS